MKSKVKGVYKKWKKNSKKLIDDFTDQFDPKKMGSFLKKRQKLEFETMESSGDEIERNYHNEENEVSDFDY